MRARLPVVFDSALALCAALLLSASLAPSVRAQSTQQQTRERRTAPPSSTTQPAPTEESGAEPDLSITARVTADSLRFERVPDPKVEFTGRPRRDTVWKSERVNLPEQVRPGVTYRNIGITLRITSVFADIDRIVAEALGEVPATDDTPRQAQPPTQPAAQDDDTRPRAASEIQETKPDAAQTSSPAKAATRAAARRRRERRGRGM